MRATLLSILLLACAPAAWSDDVIQGEYLDVDVPQACGIFRGETLFCSATIIGPTIALSAGHCFQEEMRAPDPGSRYHLRCGKTSSRRYPLLYAHPDPGFGRAPKPEAPSQEWDAWSANDRMLLATQGPRFEAPPMRTASEADHAALARAPEAEQRCMLAGWGTNNEQGLGQLNVAATTRVARGAGGILLSSRQVNRVEPGDSGGTLTCRMGGVWKLFGVTSTKSTVDTFARAGVDEAFLAGFRAGREAAVLARDQGTARAPEPKARRGGKTLAAPAAAP